MPDTELILAWLSGVAFGWALFCFFQKQAMLGACWAVLSIVYFLVALIP